VIRWFLDLFKHPDIPEPGSDFPGSDFSGDEFGEMECPDTQPTTFPGGLDSLIYGPPPPPGCPISDFSDLSPGE